MGRATVEADRTVRRAQRSTLALVAITHRRAPLWMLERVSLDADRASAVGRALVDHHGISECVVLSTCNRTELYLYGSDPDTDFALGMLATRCQGRPSAERLERDALVAIGDAAATHLLRVASGLESRVAGEVEILAQIRSAIAAAHGSAIAGPFLTSLFRYATAAGRDAQRMTGDALTPSLPRLALDAALLDVGAAPALTVVLGSGVMARSTVDELDARGLDYWVCARRTDRAARLARSAARVVAFDQLRHVLQHADVVVCATGARSPLVRVPDLEGAMDDRGGRALTIVDLSLPRNVEPEARLIPGIRLIDLDGLVSACTDRQIQHREAIVNSELRRYQTWLSGRTIGHLIARLRDEVHAVCRAAVDDCLRDFGLDDQQLASASRSMANKLLHRPTITIKHMIETGDHDGAVAVLAAHGVIVDAELVRHQCSELAMLEAS